jgi:hypothetical protein
MASKGKRFVSEYVTTQQYGGPEEGGWYYYSTEFVQTKKYSSNRTARKVADRLRNEYNLNDRYSWEERYHCAIESKNEIGRQDNMKEPTPHYE